MQTAAYQLPLLSKPPAEPETRGPLDVTVELRRIDEHCKATQERVKQYIVRYSVPVSFNPWCGRPYRNIRELRFCGYSTGFAGEIHVGTRRTSRMYFELPHRDLVVSVRATFIKDNTALAALPPMSPQEIVNSLEALKALMGANGARFRGYLVTFQTPVSFSLGKTRYNDVQTLRFRNFVVKDGELMIATRTNAAYIYSMPSLNKIVKVDVEAAAADEFSSFEQFAARFDPRFVTQDFLKVLWSETSPQHGARYRPSDFKPIGPKGRKAVQRFLAQFQSVDDVSPERAERGEIRIREVARSEKRGRDITISHPAGAPKVFFSSEYPGCGNGAYFFLATEKTVMHYVND